MLQPEIDLRSTENARKRKNGKISARGSHLGRWEELRRRGSISSWRELEQGLPGTATTSDVERRRFLLEILRRGRGREMGEIGPGGVAPMGREFMVMATTYWKKNDDDSG